MLTWGNHCGVCNMRLIAPQRRQSGVSLLELMIGIAVGLLVLASSLVTFMTGSRSATDTLRANRFNQDVREIVNIMSADIRRAGYTAVNTVGTPNVFTATANNVVISGSCILYAYDATFLGGSVGVPDAGVDFFGFRLHNNTVQMLNPTAGVASTAATACAADGNWVNLTDPSEIRVTALSFDTIGSRCLAYNMATFKADDPTTYTQWTTTAGTGPSCDSPPAGTAAPDPATQFIVETRQVQISMTANHARDATLTRATANNAVRETVLIRNNRTSAPPT